MKHNIILFFVFIIFSWDCSNDDIIPDTEEPDPFIFDIDSIDCSKYPVTGFKDYVLHPTECQIPQPVLDTISTEALVQSCLDYPYLFGIFPESFFDSQDAFESIINHFNGLKELYQRNDGIFMIFERYLCLGIENYFYDINLISGNTFIYFFLEVFLARDTVLEELDIKSKKVLAEKALETFDTNLTTYDRHSVYSLMILGNLMRLDNYQPFVSECDQNEHLSDFLDHGHYFFLLEIENTIKEHAEQYLILLKNN